MLSEKAGKGVALVPAGRPPAGGAEGKPGAEPLRYSGPGVAGSPTLGTIPAWPRGQAGRAGLCAAFKRPPVSPEGGL